MPEQETITAVEDLCTILAMHGLDARTGEAMLAYLIGVSIGQRVGSLTDDHILRAMLLGFQQGASSEDE